MDIKSSPDLRSPDTVPIMEYEFMKHKARACLEY